MKRIFAILLATALAVNSLILLSSCDDNDSNLHIFNEAENNENEHEDDYDQSNAADSDENLPQISGTLYTVTPFSNGLALANISDCANTVCINKNGRIVFSLDVQISHNIIEYDSTLRFINGWILLPDGRLCDTKGNITSPKDIGITTFWDIALADNYLIAEVVEATYSSTVKKIGVMNTEFEWVYEPSEELYSQISIEDSIYSNDFYYNGYLYMADSQSYWNLNTGEINKQIDIEFPSESWNSYSDYTYRDRTGKNIFISLDDSVSNCTLGNFSAGKAPVIYYNETAETNYYNFINEKGEFLFEPVETFTYERSNYKSNRIIGQNENIVLIGNSISSLGNYNLVKSYDDEGNLLGELDLSLLDSGFVWSISSFNDGVIVALGSINNIGQGTTYQTRLYDIYMNPLF